MLFLNVFNFTLSLFIQKKKKKRTSLFVCFWIRFFFHSLKPSARLAATK